jgi:hypothetical protein
MPLYQIREEAYGLSPAELDVLRSYEERHEGRDTLLRTFDTLQDGGAREREPSTSSRVAQAGQRRAAVEARQVERARAKAAAERAPRSARKTTT